MPAAPTISATLGTVIGSTTLTVQTTPLTITTTSLSGGNLNVAYTATLAASGEVTPYTWSLDSGALPTGLTLAGGTGDICRNAHGDRHVQLHREGDGCEWAIGHQALEHRREHACHALAWHDGPWPGGRGTRQPGGAGGEVPL